MTAPRAGPTRGRRTGPGGDSGGYRAGHGPRVEPWPLAVSGPQALAQTRSGLIPVPSDRHEQCRPRDATSLPGCGWRRARAGRRTSAPLPVRRDRGEAGTSSAARVSPGRCRQRARAGRPTRVPLPARRDRCEPGTLGAARATRRPSPAVSGGRGGSRSARPTRRPGGLGPAPHRIHLPRAGPYRTVVMPTGRSARPTRRPAPHPGPPTRGRAPDRGDSAARLERPARPRLAGADAGPGSHGWSESRPRGLPGKRTRTPRDTFRFPPGRTGPGSASACVEGSRGRPPAAFKFTEPGRAGPGLQVHRAETPSR
jgi:hypothetical protein